MNEKRFINGWRHRYQKVSVKGVLCLHLLYAGYHGVLGIMQSSIWFLALCAYYLILSVMRVCVLYADRHDRQYFICQKQFIEKISGVLLLLLSVALMGVIAISLSHDIAVKYDTIMMITIATFVFVKIGFAIWRALHRRKKRSVSMELLKNISLAEAAASVFTLQRSMIASFGECENGWIVDDITAAVVCLFVMGIGFQILFRKKKEEMKR